MRGSRWCSALPFRCLEPAFEVVDEIVGIFQADRQPDTPRRYPRCGEGGGVHAEMRG